MDISGYVSVCVQLYSVVLCLKDSASLVFSAKKRQENKAAK
jgi:hypothetical protein